MTDVEILQECKQAAVEMQAITRQIDRMTRMDGPRGIGNQALEPAGDRKTNNATAGHIQELQGLIEKLRQKQEDAFEIMRQTETIIERFVQRRDRNLIRCYYVEGLSEEKTAEEIGISRQWVNQRRNILIEELNMPKKMQKHSKILLN